MVENIQICFNTLFLPGNVCSNNNDGSRSVTLFSCSGRDPGPVTEGVVSVSIVLLV